MSQVTLTGTTDNLDTYLDGANPTSNLGGVSEIWIGERASLAAVRRTLTKFVFSGNIPSNAIVSSAVLSIYAVTDDSSNARTMRVYRQLRVWVEGEATWNIYSTGNNWATAGGFGAADCEQTDIGTKALGDAETLNEYKDITLTNSKVQEMISGVLTNNGFLIKMDTENNDAYKYNSSEAGSNLPKLVIDYTVPSGAFLALL